MSNQGKKYKKHSRSREVHDGVKDKIIQQYFVHCWTNTQIIQWLKDEHDLEFADSTVRRIITEHRKKREDAMREALVNGYSEIFRGEKEKLFQELDFYANKAQEIWEKVPLKERNSFKTWAKLLDLKHKCRDQLVQLEIASIDPEKIEDMDEAIKSIEEKLKLHDESGK